MADGDGAVAGGHGSGAGGAAGVIQLRVTQFVGWAVPTIHRNSAGGHSPPYEASLSIAGAKVDVSIPESVWTTLTIQSWKERMHPPSFPQFCGKLREDAEMAKKITSEESSGSILFRSKDDLCAVAVSPDGRKYLCAGGSVTVKPDLFYVNGKNKPNITFQVKSSGTVWDFKTHKLIAQLPEHKDRVFAAEFYTNDIVATLGLNGELLITDLKTQTSIHTGNPTDEMGGSFAIACFPKRNLIMTSMWDDSIRGWNATTGKEEFQLCGHNRGEGICCIAAHPTCPVLASSSYQTLILWDLSKQELTFRFDIPVGHVVEGLAWHPDGERLYVVDEGKLTLLSHATKSELHRFDAQRHSLKVVAVSPDGAFVAAAGGGGFVPGYANRVVSSPKKKNCVIHVWNTETLEEINQLSGHTDIVRRLAFTGDGKQLLSIASDRKLRLWDIK